MIIGFQNSIKYETYVTVVYFESFRVFNVILFYCNILLKDVRRNAYNMSNHNFKKIIQIHTLCVLLSAFIIIV